MFLQMMIPHHAGAIMMAQEALNVTAHPQIRKMSHAVISSQAREIGQMQASSIVALVVDKYSK
jgi:uncharacterized protein (DUF305 family)